MKQDSRIEGTWKVLRSPYPWLAVAAVLGVTAIAWIALEQSRHEEARQQFERRAELATQALRGRLMAYEQLLRSGAAHVVASGLPSEESWRQFVTRQQLGERLPGVHAMGYAQRLADPERIEVVAAQPPEGGRELLAGANLQEPVRRAALERARVSGQSVISGRITLPRAVTRVESREQAAFMMFLPVFHEGSQELPRRDRPTAVTGFVYGAFWIPQLLQGILDQGSLQQVDLRIHDQSDGRAAQAQLMDTRGGARAADAPLAIPRATFERLVHFPIPGRVWTLQFLSRPEADRALRADRPWIVAAGGGLAALVVLLLTTALLEAWRRAHHLSMRDPLTGLYNRRYLDETMPRELARAKRTGQHVGIVVLDIDHFKRLNDTHGHDVGDHVLSCMGEMLRNATRGGDIACRLGGEEFAIVLPGAGLEGARKRAEAIRSTFEATTYVRAGKAVGPFTLSAGVATIAPSSQDWAASLRFADRALYLAKHSGRNRVMAASEVASTA